MICREGILYVTVHPALTMMSFQSLNSHEDMYKGEKALVFKKDREPFRQVGLP
jgi:hypothetical protein